MLQLLLRRAVIGAALLAPAAGVAAAGDPGRDDGCPWDLDGSGDVGLADLLLALDGRIADVPEVLAHLGPCPAPARFFGHYTGTVSVSTSAFHAPGVYAAEAAVAQTGTGVVGYLNIVFDPQDSLGGTVTHTFSGEAPAPGAPVTLRYSDRICGAGDPIGFCYPHCAAGCVQYSFTGLANVLGDELVLFPPGILAGLAYPATTPFDSAALTRNPNRPRVTFEGTYANLEFIWMGTAIFPLPLPLFGNNEVRIVGGEITDWSTNGFDVPIAGMDPGPVIVDWCFDDEQRRGWMNQQGIWYYDWILDAEGRGVAVIVTFDDPAGVPDCADFTDPLAGDGLDRVHQDLAGIMFELP